MSCVASLSFIQQKRGATRTPTSGPVSLRCHREAFSLLDAGSLRSGSRSCWSRRLPPVMRESAVRFRHPVRVFLLLYRFAFALRRQDQLGGGALGHRLLFARAAVLGDTSHSQRRGPPPAPSAP